MKCLTIGFVIDLAQIRGWKRLGLTNRAGHVGDSRIEAALLLDDVAVLFHLELLVQPERDPRRSGGSRITRDSPDGRLARSRVRC
jgi:hypothetical protein